MNRRSATVSSCWRPSPSARRHCDPATTAGAAGVVAAAAAAASYLFSAANLAAVVALLGVLNLLVTVCVV